MELSKSQKKTARILINKALQKECKSFLQKVDSFTHSIGEEQDPYQAYLKLYKKVAAFDKQLGKQYDGLSGSHYFMAVAQLFSRDVLTVEDISLFEEEVQQKLLFLKESNW